MNYEKTLNDFDTLPDTAKREVADFIAFLKTRYITAPKKEKKQTSKIVNDKFAGLWKDRAEFTDSAAWVRGVRKQEWENNG
ncbi:DUF2281 domain-containing protein [candidate division KSB1 bacterium]|nr:DUF2281 domain-containing protein [candidate division KSB1 bacterium]